MTEIRVWERSPADPERFRPALPITIPLTDYDPAKHLKIDHLICARCGRRFDRPAARGPIPSYCRHACRQAAFRGRVRAEGRNARDVFLTEVADPDTIGEILDRLRMTVRWRREGP